MVRIFAPATAPAKYIQQGTPGRETATYQYNANGNNAVTIPITPAKLHNADGTYYETKTAKAGDVINYVKGVWGGEEPTELTVTFEANGTVRIPGRRHDDPTDRKCKDGYCIERKLFYP